MSIAKDDRIQLNVDDIPTQWYNILPDLPEPLPPPLNPGTMKPATAEDLSAIFPPKIVEQEMSSSRYIQIPEEVRDAYVLLNRPSPLQRASHLEKVLKTPAKIYFKREDLSPAGSHKPNTAIAQAYYNKEAGIENLTTETGAGQWGSALSLACSMFDLTCKVFMVRVSYDQKPFRRYVMETYGAKVFPSPSPETEFGRKLLKMNPSNSGSLGIAISEAIESAVGHESTKYAIGSVANHVLLHQTVIGEEVIKQLEMIDTIPDYMIGCVGGGSNFAGFTFPMIGQRLKGKVHTEFIAAEPKAVPSLSEGEYRYDFGDTAGVTPLFKMYTLGHEFMPSPIHAGGLRYHAMAPTVSLLANQKVVSARAYHQKEVFDAAMIFAKAEGIIPAPESSHAIKAAIDLAVEARHKNQEKVIAFNLSGHGLLDLAGYAAFLSGTMNGNNGSN